MIEKIPKFIIYSAIAVFLILLLIYSYPIIVYKIGFPYERYINVDCKYSNGTSIVIITAKTDLSDIVISDPNNSNNCTIKYLNKDSMEMCSIKNYIIGDGIYVRILFNRENLSQNIIVSCKNLDRKSIFDLIK